MLNMDTIISYIPRIWNFIKSPIVFRPMVAAAIAVVLMHFFATDVNSDLLMGTLCGSSDIEVSDFYNRVRAGGSQKALDEDIVIVNIDSVYGRDELSLLLTLEDTVSESADKSSGILHPDSGHHTKRC